MKPMNECRCNLHLSKIRFILCHHAIKSIYGYVDRFGNNDDEIRFNTINCTDNKLHLSMVRARINLISMLKFICHIEIYFDFNIVETEKIPLLIRCSKAVIVVNGRRKFGFRYSYYIHRQIFTVDVLFEYKTTSDEEDYLEFDILSAKYFILIDIKPCLYILMNDELSPI